MPKLPHIAIMGRARSGKDTVAARLVSRFQYTRVAFADPLKGMALSVDPVISAAPGTGSYGFIPWRLSDVIRQHGWDSAKEDFPEVRRTLQRIGQSVREFDSDYWVNIALEKIDVADTWNLPVVVTDVRYPNEAEALRNRGFTLVRVLRPGYTAETVTPEEMTNRNHESETALDDYPVDRVLINGGSLFNLDTEADSLTA